MSIKQRELSKNIEETNSDESIVGKGMTYNLWGINLCEVSIFVKYQSLWNIYLSEIYICEVFIFVKYVLILKKYVSIFVKYISIFMTYQSLWNINLTFIAVNQGYKSVELWNSDRPANTSFHRENSYPETS